MAIKSGLATTHLYLCRVVRYLSTGIPQSLIRSLTSYSRLHSHDKRSAAKKHGNSCIWPVRVRDQLDRNQALSNGETRMVGFLTPVRYLAR